MRRVCTRAHLHATQLARAPPHAHSTHTHILILLNYNPEQRYYQIHHRYPDDYLKILPFFSYYQTNQISQVYVFVVMLAARYIEAWI